LSLLFNRRKWEIRKAYKILIDNPEETLAEDRDQWQALLNTVMPI
jgi:hypothetical protein